MDGGRCKKQGKKEIAIEARSREGLRCHETAAQTCGVWRCTCDVDDASRFSLFFFFFFFFVPSQS